MYVYNRNAKVNGDPQHLQRAVVSPPLQSARVTIPAGGQEMYRCGTEGRGLLGVVGWTDVGLDDLSGLF